MSMTEHICVRCRKEMKVPDRYRGRELKCPGCGHAFTLPAEDPTPAEPTPAGPGAAGPPVPRPSPATASERAATPGPSPVAPGSAPAAAAGARPPALASPVAGVAKASPGPSGLGGWLAVVIGWLLVVSLTTLYQYLQVREMLDDPKILRNLERSQSPEMLQYAQTVEWLNALMLFVVVIAVLSIFTYRRWARTVVITSLLLALGTGAWDYFWVTRVFDMSGGMDEWLVGRVTVCGVVLGYFLRSRRVKNTFVK